MKRLWVILTLLFVFSCEKSDNKDAIETGDNIPPSLIDDFVARYISGEVIIKWSSKYDSDFSSFIIERSEVSKESGFKKIKEIVANELGDYQDVFDYTDSEIVKDKRYHYRIIKYDTSDNLSESNVVTASSFSKIAFYFSSEGKVYTIDIDGENIEEIIKIKISSSHLWSPDKTKIAIRVGTQTRIADYSKINNGKSYMSPFPSKTEFYDAVHWSKNEDKLFFWHGYNDISYWVNSDGSNLTEFSTPPPYNYPDVSVNTSNDYVAYRRYHNSDKGISVTDQNGNLIWKLTDNENLLEHRNPYWSRDGSKMIFTGLPSSSNYTNIFMINSDGTELTQLTNHNADRVDDWHLSIGESIWSYDDQYIFYKLANSKKIIILNVETKEVFDFTGNYNLDPIWIENNLLVSFEGENWKELTISSINGSKNTIAILPDSIWSPTELHFIPN